MATVEGVGDRRGIPVSDLDLDLLHLNDKILTMQCLDRDNSKQLQLLQRRQMQLPLLPQLPNTSIV